MNCRDGSFSFKQFLIPRITCVLYCIIFILISLNYLGKVISDASLDWNKK